MSDTLNSLYVGFVTGRSPGHDDPTQPQEVPRVLGVNFDNVAAATRREAGDHRIPTVALVGVGHPQFTPVYGPWVDELGRNRIGPIPVDVPNRWPDPQIREFEKLSARYGDFLPPPNLDLRPRLVDDLPEPFMSRHGNTTVHLVIHRGLLHSIHPTIDGARMAAIGHARNLGGEFTIEGRVHVVSVRIGVDDSFRRIRLDDPALRITSPQGDDTAEIHAMSKVNVGVTVTWSEPVDVRAPNDPDFLRYQELVNLLKGGLS